MLLIEVHNYITSRIPVPLINLGNICYLNSILQVLFQVNTYVSFDTWINHLLVVDKLSCADNLQLLAFYKFLYLCKIPSITEGDLADFTHILEKINPFFKIGIQRDAHEALILVLESFSKICYLPILNNDTSFVPEFMDAFFYGIYRIQFNFVNFVNFVKTITFAMKIFIIFLYSLIQIFLLVLSIIKWIIKP